jgi:hypothetical protein
MVSENSVTLRVLKNINSRRPLKVAMKRVTAVAEELQRSGVAASFIACDVRDVGTIFEARALLRSIARDYNRSKRANTMPAEFVALQKRVIEMLAEALEPARTSVERLLVRPAMCSLSNDARARLIERVARFHLLPSQGAAITRLAQDLDDSHTCELLVRWRSKALRAREHESFDVYEIAWLETSIATVEACLEESGSRIADDVT